MKNNVNWHQINILIASVLFQVVWLLLVLYTTQVQWFIAIIWFCCMGFFWVKSKKQFAFCLQLCVLGVLVDSGNYGFDLFVFEDNPVLIPFWLVLLWGCFAVYASQVIEYLTSLPQLVLVVLGGIGGLASYYAAFHLSAVIFPLSTLVTSIIIFVEWIGVTYAMVKLYSRL